MGIPFLRSVSVYDLLTAALKNWLSQTFDDGIAPYNIGDGSYTCALSTTKAFRGSKSLYIKTNTATPNTNDNVSAYFYSCFKSRGKVFFNMAFNAYSQLKEFTLKLEFYFRDGTTQLLPKIQYVLSTGKWQYSDSSGSWVDIPDQPPAILTNKEYNWEWLQIGLNLTSKEYVSIQYGPDVKTLSGLAIRETASTSMESYIKLSYQLNDATPAAIELWVDDVFMFSA